ncbi:hypothetical protein ACJRO7_022141 [Eucalyptus globulus]|uniref:Uncharacterized protein n=1 Tax=Eucalyptus globulus TaxID=34317 RepID=A0ABD3KM97_EUCGL
MANAATQDRDLLTRNGSRPSQEPCNLPSGEEFSASLVDFRWDAGESSLVDTLAPMATPGSHGSGEGGRVVRLDPDWFEVDLSLSDFLQVIRMEHQNSHGKE